MRMLKEAILGASGFIEQEQQRPDFLPAKRSRDSASP